LLGIVNITSKTVEDIEGFSSSTSLTASANGTDVFKQEVNLLYGSTISRDTDIMFALDIMNSDDDGSNYYDPDNIYKRGTTLTSFDNDEAGFVRVVPNDGFDNHQQDYHFKFRMNKSLFKIGLDYSDLDEGIATLLDGSNYYVNSSLTDYKWHTTRLSSFINSDITIHKKLIFKPKFYYRKDKVIDDSGFSYPWMNGTRSAGEFRSFQQSTSRYGVDLAAAYEHKASWSILFGYSFERDNTESEYSSWSSQPSERFRRKLNSIYFQSISDVEENLTLLVGSRYDKESGIGGEWMPRMGLVHSASNVDGGTFITKLLYGESFRGLATYEKEPNQDNPESAGVVPEKAKTTELQFIYSRSQKQEYDMSFWYTEIDNLRIDGTRGFNLINSEVKNYRDQITYGTQIDFKIEIIPKIDWTYNYTYTKGQEKNLYYQNAFLGVPTLIQSKGHLY